MEGTFRIGTRLDSLCAKTIYETQKQRKTFLLWPVCLYYEKQILLHDKAENFASVIINLI